MSKKTRNPVARSPLLRKGKVHEESKSARRMRAKKVLREEAAANRQRPPREDAPD